MGTRSTWQKKVLLLIISSHKAFPQDSEILLIENSTLGSLIIASLIVRLLGKKKYPEIL